MTNDDGDARPEKARSGPRVVAPTNRVNVAFPLGNIHIEESSKDLAELANIVAGLLSVVEELQPGARVKQLRDQAEGLAARLE